MFKYSQVNFQVDRKKSQLFKGSSEKWMYTAAYFRKFEGYFSVGFSEVLVNV